MTALSHSTRSSSISGASQVTSTRVSGAIGASVITAVSARAAPSKASATVDPKPRTPASASWENSSQPIVDAALTAELRTLFGASVIRLHLGNADCTGGTRRIGTSSATRQKLSSQPRNQRSHARDRPGAGPRQPLRRLQESTSYPLRVANARVHLAAEVASHRQGREHDDDHGRGKRRPPGR